MTTVAIVQARLGSSRLPAKVLLPLPTGRTVVEETLHRCKQIAGVDIVVCAIPDTTENDILEAQVADWIEYLSGNEPPFTYIVRGPEHDVLARYLKAAEQVQADIILRVTSDCPLIDPVVCARVLDKLKSDDVDYCSNVHPRTFPKGLDVECFTIEALRRAEHFACSGACREHVTLYMYTTQDFHRGNHEQTIDQSKVRLTLDTIEDYVAIWNEFKRREEFRECA
jgi:spore coat polysaccharide biosynthesis protein SpsF